MSGHSPDARRGVLAMTMMASFATPFTLGAINIALPAMAADLGLTPAQMGWVSLSFLLAACALLIPAGRAADIYGRRRVFIIGYYVFTVASVLCALSATGPLLLAARVLQGLGSALFFGTSVAILTAVTPKESRGRALGWVAASVYTGLTAGPFLGGLLSAALGWRAVFWANVPLGLVVLFLAARLRAEWKGPEGEKLDLPSSALYAVSIVLLMLGFSGALKALSAPLAAAGAAGSWYFMKREARAAHPVFHSELLFDNPVYAWASFTALLNYSASFAVGFILSLYLQYARGLSPVQAGLLLAVQPVFMAVFSPLAGRLSDRRDPGELASAGMGVTAAGILMFAIAGPSTPVPYLALALAVLGFGLALFSSPNTNAAMSAVEPRRYSVAYAALSTMRLAGQMFSMALVLLIFSMVLGKTRLGPGDAAGLLTSMRLAVVLFSVMAAAGIFTSLRRKRAAPARV